MKAREIPEEEAKKYPADEVLEFPPDLPEYEGIPVQFFISESEEYPYVGIAHVSEPFTGTEVIIPKLFKYPQNQPGTFTMQYYGDRPDPNRKFFELGSIQEEITFNTSNSGKKKEYERLLGPHGYNLTFTKYDLREIDGTPMEVVARKAMDAKGSYVEDTSLFVDGFPEAGVNIRFVQNNLGKVVGARARFLVLIARYVDINEADSMYQGNVVIYMGEVYGTIGEASGTGGFGFDPFFYPDGSSVSLADAKPDKYNARALAVENLIKDQFYAIFSPEVVINWKGSWQNE